MAQFNPTLLDQNFAASLAPNVVDLNPMARPADYNSIAPIPDHTKIGAAEKNSGGYNHFFMQFAEHFDPFIQKKTLANPRFWHDRIPRGSYPLFQGTNPKTFIYRGGLSTYAGLDKWDKIDPNPSATNNPCDVPKFSTYSYAWEALQYDGHRTGWGSDPICVDALKYQDQIQTQLAWILESGAEFGVSIQEVWNRDTYIRHSVLHNRSFIMSKEYTGEGSARYVYDPFVKFGDTGADGVANKTFVDKAFIVLDASTEVEPLNFDCLERVGYELAGECPEQAVGRSADGCPTFALMAAADDMEKYFRGNEEYRKYWIEAKPEALIDQYGLRMKTFRGWAIVNDQNQLRFKVKRFITSYTTAEALNYGNVGVDVFLNKPVFIAEYVAPRVEGRMGINGSRVPKVNPEYYTAELAIAPVFMNNIITNLFVPQVTSLGAGTKFGAVPGHNGQWGWMNIIDKESNPLGKYGNFYGMFEIFQRPEATVFYATSFLYRRCAQALRSVCPADNPEVNRDLVAGDTEAGVTKILAGATLAAAAATAANASKVAQLTLGIENDLPGMSVGAAVTMTINGTALTGCYVVNKTNSCQVTVAVPVTDTVKYVEGTLQVAANKTAEVKAGDKIAMV